MSQSEKPSTAAGNWLWNERRRISPSVTTSSPASSWRLSAPSTAASSMRLKPAGASSPRSRACVRRGAPEGGGGCRRHRSAVSRAESTSRCNTGAPSDDGTFAPLPFREAPGQAYERHPRRLPARAGSAGHPGGRSRRALPHPLRRRPTSMRSICSTRWPSWRRRTRSRPTASSARRTGRRCSPR